MKQIILIISIFLLSNCFNRMENDVNLLLLTILKDSSIDQKQNSKTKKKIDKSKDFWNNLDFAWKKAVAWQIKSIDYNNLPKTLNASQIKDALEMTELKYNCSDSNIGCYNKSEERIKHLESVKHFKNLETLNLSNNEIKTIPYEIAQVTQLKSLILKKNKIVTISTAINQLINLEVLDLYLNELKKIPKNTFTKLNQLNFLNLIKGYQSGTAVRLYEWTQKEKEEIQSQVTTKAKIRFLNGEKTGTRTL